MMAENTGMTEQSELLSVQGSLTLSQLAASLGVELSGADCSFSQLSINTRTINTGDLFVAIKGDSFDAHDYLEQAVEKGACALIVERPVDLALPQLLVKDTRIALGHIALLWRSAFSLPVVAITGSCGKTTVKEMTTAIFACAVEQVLATQGNLNNDIGVPLTLMRLNSRHKMAVIEIGANHIGEIAQLVNYVKPDAAVITNVGHAHIEGFGSIQGVAQAKAEIYSGLNNNGTAVINADDDFADFWKTYCHNLTNKDGHSSKKIKLLTFGVDTAADISADYAPVENGQQLSIKTPWGNTSIMLKQYGKHNIYNALAASALALSAGCTLTQIKAGLESFSNIAGRLEQKQGIADAVIFDDSYNANPGSVRAGIDAVQQLDGDTVLILGDMAELGEESEKLHYQLGIDAALMGVKRLFTVGVHSHATCSGFNSIIAKQGNEFKAVHFSNKDELLHKVKEYLQYSAAETSEYKRKIVLIKGSRSMQMEYVVNALLLEQTKSGGALPDLQNNNNSLTNLTKKGVQ